MNQQSTRCHVVTASALVFGALLGGSVLAQQRFVVINGQLLHPSQVQRIESLYCSPIADGRYWYDTQTGVWGYEGHPRAQGRFVYRCGQAARSKSLSERGLLYSTHEILGGRP